MSKTCAAKLLHPNMKKFITLFFAAVLPALGYDLESFDIPTPIQPSSTNTLGRAIDLRPAKSGAAVVTITATNAGLLTFTASKSIDNAIWFSDPTNNFTVPFTTGTTSFTMPLTVTAFGYEGFLIISASTNGTVSGFTFQTATKP
jgi:hypothetical protein